MYKIRRIVDIEYILECSLLHLKVLPSLFSPLSVSSPLRDTP